MKNFYQNYKKTVLSAIFLTGFFIFYTIFGFFGVPWLLKDVVPSFLEDKNVTLSIKDVKFNPYTFELNASKINLNTTSELFAAERVDLSLKFKEIFKKNINIDILRLTNPFVNIEKSKDDKFNFDIFLSKDENKTKESGDTFFNFTLNTFEIIKGAARYADESLETPFAVNFKDLTYKIDGINIKEHSVGKHNLDTNSSLFDEFDFRGGVGLNPLRIYGEMRVSGLKLDEIWKSYLSGIDVNVTKGLLDFNLNYALSLSDELLALGIGNSKLGLRNFDLSNRTNRLNLGNLSLNNINFDGIFADENNATFSIESILLNDIKANKTALKELEILNFVNEFFISQKTRLHGNIAGVALNEFSIDENIKSEFKKLELSKIDYDVSDVLKLNLENLLLKEFALKEKENLLNISSCEIKNPNLNYNINQKNINADISKLNLNKLSFKNADLSATNSLLFFENISVNSQNDFKNINLLIPNSWLNEINLEVSNLNISQPNLNFNSLNLTLQDKISLTLDELKSGKFSINSSKNKFINLNSLMAKSLNFKDNKINLANLNLEKAEVFSQNKNFSGFSQISINNTNFDLQKELLNIENIKINSPYFNDEIGNDGSKSINNLNFLNKSDKKANKEDNKFVADIKNIDIIKASSKIKQNFLPKELEHEILIKEAKIRNFSSDLSKPFGLNLSLDTSEKLNLKLQGKTSIKPLKSEFDLDFKAQDLSKLNKIVKLYLNAKIVSGFANFKSKIKLDKELSLDGNFDIKNFALIDDKNENLVEFKEFFIDKIILVKDRLDMQDISLNSPFVKAQVFQDKSFNLAKIVKENKKEEQTKESLNKSDFKISLSNFKINDTSIDYIDDSLVLPFFFRIKQVSVNVDKIQNNENSKIRLNGIVGNGGNANISMNINAFEPKKFSDLDIKFKDIELNEATPYSGTFVGRKIDGGTLDLSLNYKIENSKMQGENNIKITKIKLGEVVQSEKAANLPLALAISVLEDSNRVIDLDLPISGDLSNPSFSYSRIVLKALGQIFTDVVTSPFRLLGKALGIKNADNLKSFDFIAGEDEFLESGLKKIDDYKKITDAKKEIELVIVPSYDDKVDRFAIQKMLLDREIATLSSHSQKTDIEIISELTKKQFKTTPKDPYKALIENKKFSESKLEELAKDRAKNLKKAMIKYGISKDQIKIGDKTEKSKAQMNLYVPVTIGIQRKK